MTRNKERIDYSELSRRGARVVGTIRPVPTIIKKPEGKLNIVVKDQKIVFMAKTVETKKGRHKTLLRNEYPPAFKIKIPKNRRPWLVRKPQLQ